MQNKLKIFLISACFFQSLTYDDCAARQHSNDKTNKTTSINKDQNDKETLREMVKKECPLLNFKRKNKGLGTGYSAKCVGKVVRQFRNKK